VDALSWPMAECAADDGGFVGLNLKPVEMWLMHQQTVFENVAG
jgi:hypothetical protein